MFQESDVTGNAAEQSVVSWHQAVGCQLVPSSRLSVGTKQSVVS